ncbi:MAG: hypothetical protein ACQET3_09995, partial [Promethearchaeati archaeon]
MIIMKAEGVKPVDEKETLHFIDDQIKLEERIIEIVEETTSKLGNAFVKQMLLGIAQDSKKHAALLTSLRNAVEGPTPFISEEE